MRALCIGGPSDGAMHDVPDTHGQLATMRIAAPLEWRNPNDFTPHAFETRSAATYRVEMLHTPDREFKMLVHCDLSLDAALNTLFRCYGGQR